MEVFGSGLGAYQNDRYALFGPFCGTIWVEADFATGCARTSCKTSSQFRCNRSSLAIDDGEQELVQHFGLDTTKGGLLIDDAFFDQVDGDAHCGHTGAFAITRLQHPQFAALDSKLDVLHVFVMCFELVGNSQELFVGGWQFLCHL